MCGGGGWVFSSRFSSDSHSPRAKMYLGYLGLSVYGPRHDKTNKMAVRPAKTQISLGIRPV